MMCPSGRLVLADMQAAKDSGLPALAALLTAAGALDIHLARTPVTWIGAVYASAPGRATK